MRGQWKNKRKKFNVRKKIKPLYLLEKKAELKKPQIKHFTVYLHLFNDSTHNFLQWLSSIGQNIENKKNSDQHIVLAPTSLPPPPPPPPTKWGQNNESLYFGIIGSYSKYYWSNYLVSKCFSNAFFERINSPFLWKMPFLKKCINETLCWWNWFQTTVF